MFLGTANQATEDMGSSAKELTKPMISRQGMGIDIRQIADAEKADYLSRTLKHLTGVPAYHVYMMDPETFDRNPEQLAETLMYFRTVGLTPEEKKKIPQEELFNIRHIDRTIKVATQYGALLSEAENIIKKEIEGIPAYTYWWGEKKDNPIMGFWALADNIIATGDSVSMPCECCGSGKPVLLFTGKGWLTPKHERFVKSLIDGGYAVHIDAPDALSFRPQKTLNPAGIIAEKIDAL